MLNTWRGEGWSACQTISSVLVTLASILTDKPLLNEPGVSENHLDFNKYNQIITFKNYQVGILQMLKGSKPNALPPSFNSFSDIIQDNFMKNYDRIMKKINDLERDNPEEFGISTNIYSLNVTINCKKVRKSLEKTIFCYVQRSEKDIKDKQNNKARKLK